MLQPSSPSTRSRCSHVSTTYSVRSTADRDDATTFGWWVRTIASWLLLLAMLAVLGALVVAPRLTGSTAYTVLTGSMQPGLPPGTLIVSRPASPSELRAGDVITFQPVSGAAFTLFGGD